MTGLVLGLAAFGAGQVSPYADGGAAVDAAVRMKVMAGPLLKPRRGEGADIEKAQAAKTRRDRLEQIADFQVRSVGQVARLKAAPGGIINALQNVRDTNAEANSLVSSPWVRLGWRAAALELTEKLDALGRVYVQQGLEPPQVLAQTGAQVRNRRDELGKQLAGCLATLPRPRR